MEIKDAPSRPTITDDLVFDVAKLVYPDEDDARSIAEHFCRHMDGYELAKELDSRAWWDCDRNDVDKLDGVICKVERQLREAEKKWCEENDIQPSLPVGTRLQLPRDRLGTITGVADKHSPACYLVKDDDDSDETSGNRRFIIKFEAAVVAE